MTMHGKKSRQTTPHTWELSHYDGSSVITGPEGEPWVTVCGVQDIGIVRAMAGDLKRFMNGGSRPKWLDDMERSSETSMVGIEGSRVIATGPMYDANPPALHWKECDDPRSRDARARLIDRLSGVRGGLCP